MLCFVFERMELYGKGCGDGETCHPLDVWIRERSLHNVELVTF